MNSQDDQSLTDPHLNAYFKNKRIRRHLIKAGLINRQGDILPSTTHEVPITRREKHKRMKNKLSYTITNYVLEEDRKRQAYIRNYFDFAMKRSRVQKIRESKHPNRRSLSHSLIYLSQRPKYRNARTPSPVQNKTRPIVRVKSAYSPPTNVKNLLVRRQINGKQQSNDDYCEVTMIYFGPPKNVEQKKTWYQPDGDELVVMQQHCGGENLPVFKGFIRPNQTFTFDSRRHRDYPFALALYINGLIDSRISVCCEYKHKHNVRLGSRYGLFGIYDVKKSQPCRMCRFEHHKKKILSMAMKNEKPSSPSPSPSPSSSDQKQILTTEFPLEVLLRTPTVSPEREKPPTKRQINRISTVVQISPSPRRLSSASSQNKDEINEFNKSHTSEETKDDRRNSSRILFKNEEPHHSSEPILATRNNDRSLSRSTESAQTPVPFVYDDGKKRQSLNSLSKNKTYSHSSRSSSRTSKISSSSSSISLVKNDENHIRSKSPLSTSSIPSSSSSTISFKEKNIPSNSSPSSFFSDKKDDHPVLEVPPIKATTNEKPSSRTSSSSSSSSSNNKTNDNLIKAKRYSSSSSTTTESDEDTLLSDKQSQSPELTEHNHHSNKNEYEIPRLSTSSTDSEEQNEIIPEDPIK